jgi:hypothetical protein
MEEAKNLLEIPRSNTVIFSSQELPSSPPSVELEAGTRLKPKRPPPVTPRSFKRFFTPRSALNAAGHASSVRTNRQALAELSCPNLNRLGPAFTKASQVSEPGLPNNPPLDIVVRTPSKKRKLSFSSPTGSPQQSSPLRKVRTAATQHAGRELQKTVRELEIGPSAASKPKGVVKEVLPAKPLRRSVVLQTCGGLCLRSVVGAQAARVDLRSIYSAGNFPFTLFVE